MIRKWFQRQEPYNLQGEDLTYFKGNVIITLGIDDKWDAYPTDLFTYVKDNDGVAFIPVVIDIFKCFFECAFVKTRNVKVSLQLL